MKQTRMQRGQWGANCVRQHFESLGFKLAAHSLRPKDEKGRRIWELGEVDLFLMNASKKLGLVLEVKTRSSTLDPLLLLSAGQLHRLRRSRAYLQAKHPDYQIQLGLVLVKAPEATLEFFWNPC